MNWLERRLIFIMGKGGVGRSTVARAAAIHLASTGKRVLLCNVPQVAETTQLLTNPSAGLWEITLNTSESFKEYIILKIKLKSLYTLFLGNMITKYLERAAPGVREMVLLGKVWFERNHYDHVVVDMPSSGYAMTMIHTPFNFANLFPGGPIYNDAKEMIATFGDQNASAFVTVSLLEEMPLQESVELAGHLREILPENPPSLVLNREVRVPEAAKNLFETKKSPPRNPLWLSLEYLMDKQKRQESLLLEFESALTKSHRSILHLPESPARFDLVRARHLAEIFSKVGA